MTCSVAGSSAATEQVTIETDRGSSHRTGARAKCWLSDDQRQEMQMPAFIIPVLIGIPVLVVGGYYIVYAIK